MEGKGRQGANTSEGDFESSERGRVTNLNAASRGDGEHCPIY